MVMIKLRTTRIKIVNLSSVKENPPELNRNQMRKKEKKEEFETAEIRENDEKRKYGGLPYKKDKEVGKYTKVCVGLVRAISGNLKRREKWRI